MTQAELTHRAIEILIRDLGAADALRFVNQFSTGAGDYTTERRQLFAGRTLAKLIAEIKATRPTSSHHSRDV